MLASAPSHKPVVYPTSDGKPVAETDVHFLEIVALQQLLACRFAARADVYVAANNFVYYEEGNPKAVFSPDVYVVHGVPKKQRDCFCVWNESGRVPSVVFEFTSKSTRREDAGDKKTKCASIGVSEYFMYDPKHEYLTPSLQGFRLENGFYKFIAADAQGRLECRTLKLKLFLDEHGLLRVCDAKTGKILPRTEARIADAEANAKREAQARQDAEAEIARLREELKRFKNG